MKAHSVLVILEVMALVAMRTFGLVDCVARCFSASLASYTGAGCFARG